MHRKSISAPSIFSYVRRDDSPNDCIAQFDSVVGRLDWRHSANCLIVQLCLRFLRLFCIGRTIEMSLSGQFKIFARNWELTPAPQELQICTTPGAAGPAGDHDH